jgi:putative cell wall-binding protein
MVQEVARGGNIQLIGQSITIETSLQNRPVTLLLPLPAGHLPEDEGERAAFLEDLVIYIEHSNGQKELLRPNAVEYAPGQWGLQWVVDHFSLFSMLHIEGAAAYFNQGQTKRLYGADRYETAVHISQAGWKDGARTVILARGDDFADALAATVLAYEEDAPILLSGSHQLPEAVIKEIKRLKPERIILIGGPSALSEAVEEHLSQQLKGLTDSIERIGGKNRYATAVEIARRIGSGTAVFLANGMDFPDALAVAPYAARLKVPILLTRADDLPEETREALANITHTWVIGGEKAVSAGVYRQLPSPERIGGANRYGTAAQVMATLDQRFAIHGAYVASGSIFPDALAGSVLAAKANRPLLLVEPDRLSQETKEIIREKGMKAFTFLGGPSAIGEAVLDEVNKEIGSTFEEDR